MDASKDILIARQKLTATLVKVNVRLQDEIKQDSKLSGASVAGIIYGNVSNASTLYGMDKFSTPRGHGFAAERANHLYDKITGKKAVLEGDNFVKNGADRIVDVVNIFRGRISGKQLFKNVANTASTVAGGTAGWVGGATAGAAIGSAVPIIGTAIGGLVGGLLGSFAAGSASGKVSNAILGSFIEDDADEMVRIIEKVFAQMAEEYLLNQLEAENIVDCLKEELNGKTLKDMYASSNKEVFAMQLLQHHIEEEVKKRKVIKLPSQNEMQRGLKEVLEEISDNLELESAY